jgi:hypothetical protein
MKISFEAAEGVKTMLANKAEPQLKTLVSPLASELKASMDYFETTYEKGVNRCYVFGRSAQSSVILKLLQDHELVPLQPWEFPPPPAFTVAQPKQAESQRLAPELGLAVGAGMAWLDGKAKTLNLLATQQEADEARRRDPLRLGGRLALGLLALMVLWSALIGLKMMLAQHQLVGCRTQLAAVEKASGEVTENYRQVVKNEAQFNALVHQATHRFLAAPLLDALQRSTVENLVLTKLHVDRAVNTWALDAEGAKKRARSTEVLTLTIQAKDYTDLGATEDFISALATNPYFAGRLSSPEAIVLKNRVPRQVDTEDPARSFSLVTLECVFKEREIGRE